MRINGHVNELIRIGKPEMEAITSKIKELTDEWEANTHRQDIFSVHTETKSIIFKFQLMSNKEEPVITYPEWEEWKVLLEPLMIQALKKITTDNNGVIIKAMLTMVPAGCSIAPHVDMHWSFDTAHRVHLPIITNDLVDFNIEGKIYHLKEGTFYEINNKLKHSVTNRSDKDRVHLIFDYKSQQTKATEEEFEQFKAWKASQGK